MAATCANYRVNRCFIVWHQGCSREHTVVVFYAATNNYRKEKNMEAQKLANETCNEEPRILEEIQVEELAIDGICGVY